MNRRVIPCPSNMNGECKYAPDCHLSEHHLYPRRTADSQIKRRFGNLAVNKILSCRMIHDILDTFPAPGYPPIEVMQEAIDD